LLYAIEKSDQNRHATDISDYKVYRIFHNPDSLKLFAFTGVKRKRDSTSIARDGQVYSYEGQGIMGYRNTPHSPWLLYNFFKISFYGYDSHAEVEAIMNRYFLGGGLKRDGHFVLNKQGTQDYKFGGNIGDQAFWDCLLWQKSEVAPDLFNFQIDPHVVWDWDVNGKAFVKDKWSIIHPLPISSELPPK
jgi:hypothetical protein